MKNFAHNKPAKLLSLFLLLFTVSVFTSCDKNDDKDVKGNAHVMVVNAVAGSGDVDFYIDGNKKNSSAIASGSASGYTSVEAGKRNIELKESTTLKSRFEISPEAGKYYSVFYTGTVNNESFMVVEDDRTQPAEGKARVRFVNATSASGNIDLGILSAGAKLVSDLAYKGYSAYQTVDANTTFVLYPVGSAIVGLSMPTEIKAGKIYTIYITGSTLLNLKYHVLLQN